MTPLVPAFWKVLWTLGSSVPFLLGFLLLLFHIKVDFLLRPLPSHLCHGGKREDVSGDHEMALGNRCFGYQACRQHLAAGAARPHGWLLETSCS